MQVEKLQDDIVASHGVGDAQDAQDNAVRALASGRNFFFCDARFEPEIHWFQVFTPLFRAQVPAPR